jgi:hemoglobin-like flavoprotein
MTPQQVKLVTDSFMKVLPIAGVTADLFYDHLFEIAPEVRPLFPDNLVEQKKKFIATLATLIANLHEFGKIAPVVADLGKRHVDYGIVAKHYEPFGAALFRVLEDCLGVDFTPSVKAAWTEAYRNLADVMKRAAANLPPG